MYQRHVSKNLARYGLRYDDVLIESPPVQKAVSWMSKEDQIARERRLTRAADLGFKRTYLPQELQEIQEPMNHYLHEDIKEATTLEQEREELTRW